MKKTLSILLISVALMLSGCAVESNQNTYTSGSHRYNIIHISDFAGNAQDFTISQWWDSSVGIEVELSDGNNVFCSEGTYILAKDYCPICGRK